MRSKVTKVLPAHSRPTFSLCEPAFSQTKVKRLRHILILLILLFLSGCGLRELSAKQAKEKILATLEQKYGEEFKIETIEKENIGQNFSRLRWKATVRNDKGATFRTILNTDGTCAADEYAGILFGTQILETAENILKETTVKETDPSLVASYSEDFFENAEDYISSGCVSFYANLSLQGDINKATEELFRIIHAFEKSNFSYSFAVSYNGRTIYITWNTGDSKTDQNTIEKKIAEGQDEL